jgi:uncharacterized protein (TIGR02145 family)
MKKLLPLIAALFININLFSQAPQKMSYQAVIRNASNALVSNAPVKMRISILQSSATGNAVYSELHSATTNANGLVSIEIGAGTSPQGTFSSINWGNGTYFLKTETDPTNGTNYSIVGTSQLLSVPYALFSNDVPVRVSPIGDTLIIGNSNKIVIPGISIANNVADASGNVYSTIKIGAQVWMAENLRTVKYRDGSNIEVVSNIAQWSATYFTSDKKPMMCWYNNDSATYTANKFGALYNWYAINSASNGNKNVCPMGWHVPTDDEWSTLTNFLGGNLIAGGKMKAVGTQFWLPPNSDATNSSGFSALPSGNRNADGFDGSFFDLNTTAAYWTSTDIGPFDAWARSLSYNNGNTEKFSANKSYGYSVRCIKD